MDYKKLLFTCVLTTSNAISSPVEIIEIAEERDRQEKRGQPFKNSLYQQVELDGVYKVESIGADECLLDITETVTGLSGLIRARTVRITTKPEFESMIPLFIEIYADKCIINDSVYECRPYSIKRPELPVNKIVGQSYYERFFKPKIGLAQILEGVEQVEEQKALSLGEVISELREESSEEIES